MQELDLLNEEVFCLKFELKTLADKTVRNKAERWLDGYIEEVTHQEHLARYLFATQYTEGKRVLDIACGSGYGSFILATQGKAQHVDGVDLDADAVRYGNHRYNHPNISRYADNAVIYNSDLKYDVIISFETVEHIQDYEHLLLNYRRLLSPEGVLLISTPVTGVTTTTPANPFHVIEWSFEDFQNLVKSYFVIHRTMVQSLIIKNEKHYPALSFTDRMKFKLRPDLRLKYLKKVDQAALQFGNSLEEFTNQYPHQNIINGYQIVVAGQTLSD